MTRHTLGGNLWRNWPVALLLVLGLTFSPGCDELGLDLGGFDLGLGEYGYSGDYAYGGDGGYSAGDALETHLGNYVDYGDGVPWSTQLE